MRQTRLVRHILPGLFFISVYRPQRATAVKRGNSLSVAAASLLTASGISSWGLEVFVVQTQISFLNHSNEHHSKEINQRKPAVPAPALAFTGGAEGHHANPAEEPQAQHKRGVPRCSWLPWAAKEAAFSSSSLH